MVVEARHKHDLVFTLAFLVDARDFYFCGKRLFNAQNSTMDLML
jgi:hypothetical protein